MDIKKLMQLKCTMIHLHKINDNHNDSNQLSIKKLNFSSFIKPKILMMQPYDNIAKCADMDRLKYICDILEFSDFSSAKNTIKEMDLSDNSLSNGDLLQIISAMNRNKTCSKLSNIHTLDLSQNMLIGDDNECINALFELIATKMTNLEQLVLSETGCNEYIFDAILHFAQQHKHHCLRLINLSNCDDLMIISGTQCEQIDALSNDISVIYDAPTATTTATASEEPFGEFEFGFDFNQIAADDDDEEVEDDQDDDGDMSNKLPLLCLKMESDCHSDSGYATVYHQDEREALSDSSDDDGFVYLDTDDMEW